MYFLNAQFACPSLSPLDLLHCKQTQTTSAAVARGTHPRMHSVPCVSSDQHPASTSHPLTGSRTSHGCSPCYRKRNRHCQRQQKNLLAALQILVNPPPAALQDASAHLLYIACPHGPLAVLYDTIGGMNGRTRPHAPPLDTVAQMLEAADAAALRQMEAQWRELERWHATQRAAAEEAEPLLLRAPLPVLLHCCCCVLFLLVLRA